VPNPAQASWFDITIAHGDIGFGLQNNWEHPGSALIGDFRIDVRGEPKVSQLRLRCPSPSPLSNAPCSFSSMAASLTAVG
jgi:hypothetical protein